MNAPLRGLGTAGLSPDVMLLCIPPKFIPQFWPHAKPLIVAAMHRGALSRFDTVEIDVLAGHALLWLAWDGSAILAAAVTQLISGDHGKVCMLLACGGHDMRRWLPLLDEIEDYARAERCVRMRIAGRKGWLRVLKGYADVRVILERTL